MVYKPGLENRAADALSRVPAVVHLNYISTPTLLDLIIIKEEVENDTRLREIISELERDENAVPYFSLQQGILKYKGRLVISKTSTLLPYPTHIP